MRGTSSALSVTTHIAIGAAVIFGTTKAPARNDHPMPPPILVFPEPTTVGEGLAVAPSVDVHPGRFVLPPIDLPAILPQRGARPAVIPIAPSAGGAEGTSEAPRWFSESAPEVLAGPVPRYPDLLRQAGIQGRVVLQAVVDTSGHVDRTSLEVVFASHPGFVGPAADALCATVFRPGRAHGRPVRVQIRLPFEFNLRDGSRTAR